MAGTDLTVARAAPVADYTGLDQSSIERQLTAYAPGTEYKGTIRLMGFLGDMLAYMIDSHVRELYSATARRPGNMRNIAQPSGYVMPTPESSTVQLEYTLDPNAQYPLAFTVTDQFSNGSTTDEVIFQPLNPVDVPSYPAGGLLLVDCIEGERYANRLLLISNGGANQRAQFPQDTVVQSSVVLAVAGVLWAPVLSWSGQSGTAQVYRLLYDSSGHVFAEFGDGNFGAVPPSGARIVSTFRAGGGERGNLDVGTVTTIVRADPAVLSVTNLGKSSGGENAQSVKAARYAIPAFVSTLRRAVSSADHAKLATTFAGVAKAFADKRGLQGTRRIRLIVAPTGGGAPTHTLRNALAHFFRTSKMVASDVEVTGGFVYKDVQVQFLLYVNKNYKATVVNEAVRRFFVNSAGSGKFDFDQLAPAGVEVNSTDDADLQLLLGLTRIQGFFDKDLKAAGVDRVVIEKFTVRPSARAREQGNAGNGVVADASISVNGLQRRREYYVRMTSASQFNVVERVVGYVSSLTDYSLVDDAKDFSNEGITSFAGYRVAPRRSSTAALAVSSLYGQIIGVTAAGMYGLTAVGEEYYLFNPAGSTGLVNTPFVTADGSVAFTVSTGSTPFLAGDAFSIDVFPPVSDIRLRGDEYPQVTSANLTTRTTGGAKT